MGVWRERRDVNGAECGNKGAWERESKGWDRMSVLADDTSTMRLVGSTRDVPHRWGVGDGGQSIYFRAYGAAKENEHKDESQVGSTHLYS